MVAVPRFDVDEGAGLVCSVVSAAVEVADVTWIDKLPRSAENVVCADAGYTSVEIRTEHDGRGGEAGCCTPQYLQYAE